jgi:hypothetical protein
MKGLAQGAARGGLVELGPEEAEEGVATDEFAGRAGCDAGEDGDALGLREEGVKIPAVRGRKLQRTEEPKPKHWDRDKVGRGPLPDK